MRYLFFFNLFVSVTFGQQADTLKTNNSLFNKALKGDPLSIQGTFGANFRSNHTWGLPNRQNPFGSTISGSATIQSYQFSMPFSFILNNLSSPEATTPFSKDYFDLKKFFSNQKNRLSRFGTSPQKGWIKGHLGHRYMNFSEYTMNNHNFLGAGIELTPGKFRMSAFGGRQARADLQNKAKDNPNFQQYERNGWGLKVGYGDSRNFLDAILFRSADKMPVIDEIRKDTSSAKSPLDNLVLGMVGKKTIGEFLSFDFEFAQSALTLSRYANNYREGAISPLFYSFLFKTTSSTDFTTAFKSGLTWNMENLQLALNYSRVDPGFRSLGTYFFNNDLEDIRASFSFPLLENSVQFNGALSLQRNNLDKKKNSDFLYLRGNLNIDYRKNNWSLGGRFNNNDSRVDYVFDPNVSTDSLIVRVISGDYVFHGGYNLTTDAGRSVMLNFNAGFQGIRNLENGIIVDSIGSTQMFFTNVNANFRNVAGWQYSGGVDYNFSKDNARWGITGMLVKSFLKDKLNISLGSNAYLNMFNGNKSISTHHYLRSDCNIGKNSRINFQLSFLTNSSTGQDNPNTRDFREFTGSIGYNTRFGWKSEKK